MLRGTVFTLLLAISSVAFGVRVSFECEQAQRNFCGDQMAILSTPIDGINCSAIFEVSSSQTFLWAQIR